LRATPLIVLVSRLSESATMFASAFVTRCGSRDDDDVHVADDLEPPPDAPLISAFRRRRCPRAARESAPHVDADRQQEFVRALRVGDTFENFLPGLSAEALEFRDASALHAASGHPDSDAELFVEDADFLESELRRGEDSGRKLRARLTG
jgi:hypothetical protein